MASPWKIIAGKFPTQKELEELTHDKWMSVLMFLSHFLEFREKKDGTKKDTYAVTMEKIRIAEQTLEIPDHSFHEWVYRMNQWADSTTTMAYFHKLKTLARICLGYLKKHPHKVSDEMKEYMLKFPEKLSWPLTQYVTQTLSDGTEIVKRDTSIKDDYVKSNTSVASVQAKMMTSLINLADLYESLTESLSKKEIKAMDAKDKINALGKLSFIFQMANRKTGPSHFTQININGNSKDIEKEMLEYIKSKNK